MTTKQVPKPTKPDTYIALGFDEAYKPRGARFISPNVDLLIKAAEAMCLNLYEARSPDMLKLAAALPHGKLLSTGKGMVPNIKQDLYSDIVQEIAFDSKTEAIPRGKLDGPLPVIKGLPESWDKLDVGHLVLAQECHEYGWLESIVTARKADMLTLRYRDYPNVPKFYRHVQAVALMSTSAR